MSNLVKSDIQKVETTDLTPIEIALGVDEKGRTTAKKLYEFLELDPSHYSRWAEQNITKNEFAEENVDFKPLAMNGENSQGGRPSQDYKLSVVFAKKLAMGTHNHKGELAKEYFIKVEEKLKEVANPYRHMSKELKAIFTIDRKQQEIERRVDNIEFNSPLYTIECKEIQSIVQRIGTRALGGHGSRAYNDRSLRTKVYSDIQCQLRREFGVRRYEAIKRCQFEKAKEIIQAYKAPTVLQDQIIALNNQISVEEVI